MSDELTIVEVTDRAGGVVEPGLLALAEPVHRQLRPHLPVDYARRIAEVCAGGGRMVVALVDGQVAGLGLWRTVDNTYDGRRLFVDDLVTDEARRSQGIGRALLGWLEDRAGALGCQVLALESGVQRDRAHAFYFREGMTIPSFSFRKKLV